MAGTLSRSDGEDLELSETELMMEEVENLAETLGITLEEALAEYESEISFLSAQEG